MTIKSNLLIYSFNLWGRMKGRDTPKRRAVELTWKIFSHKVVPCRKSMDKRGYNKHKKRVMVEGAGK